jgi:tetrahydromethanopterin S-methyltransferase subunit F
MKKRQRTVMVVMNDLAVVRERDGRVERVGERVLLIARENRRVVGHHGAQMFLSCCF